MASRSFSLGRVGEAEWEHLRAAYVLSRKSGVIAIVASDSRDVRDEVRRRLEAMAPRLDVIEPSNGVVLAIHACATESAGAKGIPVAWIEAPASAPPPEQDMRWIEALTLLNQTRDALQMRGPCHVVLAGPRGLHDLARRRAPDVMSFVGGHVILLDDTLEELVTQQGTLTWLHLSDLHVKSESWQHDHVLGTLVRDLPTLLDERELRPDLLFVTGDLATRGQRSEYDGTVLVLDDVCKRLGLDRHQQVFVVPGNHDVDRSKISRLARRDHASLLELGSKELREAVGELLGDAKEFRLYGERLEEWCAFTETLLGRARSVSVERPWRSDVVDVRGLPVGVLSLCTVWASGPDDRKGSLILGERQIHDMVAEARDGGAQLVIALMHHPLHWLHDGEHSAIRGRLEREVDVILHGHVHDAHAALHVAARSAHVEIGAGAAYAGLGEDPHHGFSVGQLDLTGGRLDVYGFTWSTRSGEWHADVGAPGADAQGKVAFSFSPAAIAPAASRRAGTEVLATRMRHAAAKVYATVDFAGLRAGGPRRHVTLEEIFVPLRLTAKDLEGAGDAWFEGKPERFASNGDREAELDPGDRWEVASGHVSLAGLEAMLATDRKVVVLGGPGSGKSTLSKYIASTTAQREGGPVPLLLTVRDWIAEGKREHLLDMAARQAAVSLSVRTDRAALEALCERGSALLIVDGVDEAADPAVRRALRDQLHGFVATYPGVPVLVTSRIAGYHDVPLDDDEFDELMLEPFDDEAIEQFVRRWYDLVEDDPAMRLERRVNLLHALEVEPRAKELARNPLLATLIGMVHFSHAQLPGDRAKLYGSIIELLLITWPAERKRELPGLHGTVQQPMLEKLALRLQEQRAGTRDHKSQAEVLITIDQLESMLEELLAEHQRERSAPERRYLAHTWGKWLVDGCGLLQEQQPGRVGFLHLSLMEHMAGRALFERTASGGYEAVAELVVARHDEAVWRETLLLMLGSENKKRELGQVVVERLLAAGPDKPTEWSKCVFGLALLREEVDMGGLRERLLERTCEAALDVMPWEWYQASTLLANVVRFGRTHGQSTREWLRAEISGGADERWIGAVALSGKGVIGEPDIYAWVEARRDRAQTVLALLDFGPQHMAGQWARQNGPRDVLLRWARSTPTEGMAWRSMEGLGAATDAAWIPALLARAAWTGRITREAAEVLPHPPGTDPLRGAPESIASFLGEDAVAISRLPTTWSVQGVNDVVSLRFARDSSRALAKEFSRALVVEFARDFARKFARDFKSDFERDFARNGVVELASDFASDSVVVVELARKFASDIHTTRPPHAHISTNTTSSLWARLQSAKSSTEASSPMASLKVRLFADPHAALVLTQSLRSRDISSTLATVRLQNRWLDLFFTPLVEHATKTRPLPAHPELHALLLTYGLIQYQTTWEWPDCPHWRSWFAADPPAHWLPAHVWHLVRSIQDPTDSTHRALADAALDRNDWPELAQALRETTLVPTPPEALALFDHGDGTEDTTPPQ